MPEVLRWAALRAAGVPFSRPTINNMIAEGQFPRPIPYGRQVAWLRSDVESWRASFLSAKRGGV
jgi:predicted DNA-binding transcriptional regulator AlpA